MAWRPFAIGFLRGTIIAVIAATPAYAQSLPQEVRFLAGGTRAVHWQGYLERLTRDSLFVRVRGTDTVAAFARTAVDSVERQRLVKIPKAASVGCLTVGGALGALGYFGTHDPDSPGLEKTVGVVGAVVGCGIGAIGGLVASAIRGHQWEPWTLPAEIPMSPPPDQGRARATRHSPPSPGSCALGGPELRQ